MSLYLKKKFEQILAKERSLANAVARSVIKPKPIGVWDMMIPLIFFINFMKNREVRELFVQNFIFTKQLAIQAAFDMLTNGQSRESVLAHVEEKTNEVLEEDTKGIYSQLIREEQIKEVDLLIDHYCLLLNAQGRDYTQLVQSAYQNQYRYTDFIETLAAAEKEVAKAARLTLGEQADMMALVRLEDTTNKVRIAEVDRIFGS